jgi:hypothetical protein
MHVYEVRSREDKRGVDLISDVLPFGRLWYTEIRRNRIHETSQPLTLCCDSRLRSDWQRDRNARAQGRFQGAVICFCGSVFVRHVSKTVAGGQ